MVSMKLLSAASAASSSIFCRRSTAGSFLHLLDKVNWPDFATFKILAREKNVTLKMSSKSWKDIVTDPKSLFDVKDMMKLYEVEVSESYVMLWH